VQQRLLAGSELAGIRRARDFGFCAVLHRGRKVEAVELFGPSSLPSTSAFCGPPPSTTSSSPSSARSTYAATMFLSVLLHPYILASLPILFYLLPYIRNWSIRSIPGPFPAQFSSLWLMYQCRRGRRFLAVDAAHKRLGTFVRIQPHHVSVADAEAINAIYGHGNGFLKRYIHHEPRGRKDLPSIPGLCGIGG